MSEEIKKIKAMKLFDEIEIKRRGRYEANIVRVHGGYLYRTFICDQNASNSSVFIPTEKGFFDDERKSEKPIDFVEGIDKDYSEGER